MQLKKSRIQAFQHKIFSWWETNKREFPWRKTRNPYYVLVAEVMLQQTQATRVEKKFRPFIEEFPTVEDLANAETSKVLSLWSGLGYNRRAIWLQDAAKKLSTRKQFPKTCAALKTLKGVGPYTARAVLIFAFNKDIVTVDTNVRRVLIAEGFADENASKKELYTIAKQLLPKGRSREWHNALMDYGSLVASASQTGISPPSSQPDFEGSNRDYRGRVVKMLTQQKKATKKTIIDTCQLPRKKAKEVLDSLLADNLIVKQGKYFRLPR